MRIGSEPVVPGWNTRRTVEPGRNSWRRPVDAPPAPALERVLFEMKKVIVGQERALERMLVSLLARGHCLLESVPGLAKTLSMETLAATVGGTFRRIQFTPDLLPADIVGTRIYRTSSERFDIELGPVFANFVLADEINRAPAKVQSALLEIMAEHHVTIGGQRFDAPQPFLVLATQNPIELAGTFPLPEAQLDRFLLKLNIGYPDREAEIDVLQTNKLGEVIDALESVIETDMVVSMMKWAAGVNVSSVVEYYIVDLCQETRPPKEQSLMMGASPRASLALMRAARVLAASQGREDVIPDDVKALIKPVLAHRLILTPDAGLRDETIDNVVDRIVARVKIPVGVKGGAS